jgi:holliday junction DNA helicase RuvB
MRLISGKVATEDSSIDFDLRPRRLSEFIGQEKIKDNLKIAILAAKKEASH